MRLLLDTHALLWFIEGDKQLPSDARTAITNPDNDAFASAVSAYELRWKYQCGLLDLPFVDELETMMRRARLVTMPITFEQAFRAGAFPGPHRDPWDRMLMAQAELENCVVVTRDKVFRDYGIKTLW